MPRGRRMAANPAAATMEKPATTRYGMRAPARSYSQPPSVGPIMKPNVEPDITRPITRPRSCAL